MLEELLVLASRQLDLSEDRINQWRADTDSMTANEEVGSIRQRQLSNILCSSTSTDAQIDSFEQTYWDMEKRYTPMIRDVVVPLLALARQRSKIEALKEARLRHRERPLDTSKPGTIHKDYREHVDTLAMLGAGPSMVRQMKLQEEAIIADLIRWKAEDPRFENLDNPWIDILGLYAQRTMEKVDRGKKAGARSVRGAPPPENSEQRSTNYWRYKLPVAAAMSRQVMMPNIAPALHAELPDELELADDGGIVETRAAATPSEVTVATPQVQAVQAPLKPSPVWSSGLTDDIMHYHSQRRAKEAAVIEVDPSPVQMPELTKPIAPSAPQNPRPSRREMAARIVQSRMEDLWRVIGLEGAPATLMCLQMESYTALRLGAYHVYLREIEDLASYKMDLSFLDEFIERQTGLVEQQLDDPVFYEEMRAAGFAR